jgi:type I restriction enzyme S subunit
MTWPTAGFGDLLQSSQNGFGNRRGEGEPTVVLRLADVNSESWAVSSADLRAIGMSPDERAKYGLRQGDLLVIRVNGSPSIAGRVVPYTGTTGFAFCDHFIRFQLVERADARFVAYQFRHRPVRAQVERGMVSTAGQHTVSQRTFANVTVELPPLDEQHRIVAAIETHFSRLDAAVASLRRAKANVKRARASVLKAAV